MSTSRCADLQVSKLKRATAREINEYLRQLRGSIQQGKKILEQFIFGDLASGVKSVEAFKDLYTKVGDSAHAYVVACKNAATYVRDSEIMEGDATGLKSFLDGVRNLFTECRSCHEKYSLAVDEFRDEAMRIADMLEREKMGLKKDNAHLVVKVGLWAAIIASAAFPPGLIAIGVMSAAYGGVIYMDMLECKLRDRKFKNKRNEKLVRSCDTALTYMRVMIIAMQNDVEYSCDSYVQQLVAPRSDGKEILKKFKVMMIGTLELAEGYLTNTMH
eukprot:Em0017g296a